MRVLGISGSLRRDSYNTALLRHAGDLFEADGAEFEIYHGLREVPPYDEDYDTEEAPEAVSRIREAVRDADAVFFVTPEYNSSIPGALKNALDWISRPVATNPLRYKPVAVIGASSGVFGAVWAQAELRKVLGAIGARVTDGEVAVRRRALRRERPPERAQSRAGGTRGHIHTARGRSVRKASPPDADLVAS
jgi:chromate reductase